VLQGTHIGNLWTINGINLASATFTNETGSGWQTVMLSTPVAITANTIYIVSYFSQNGDFVYSRDYFATNIINGPLKALASTVEQGNGVYKLTTTSAFPTQSNLKTNYWADILFSPSAPVSSSLFQSTTPPANSTYIYGNGTAPYELGVKFSSNVNGYVTGFRFFKGEGMQGTHTGSLWSIEGTKLATAIFTNETESGWQTVTLNSPVAITANTIYVVSYFSQKGDFVFSRNYFTTNIVNGPLTALASTAAQPNGVYKQTATSAFPTLSNLQTNYWADVLFSSALPPPTSFALGVKVQDNGIGNLSNQATIAVSLTDNLAPVINDQSFTVNENSANGTTVGTVVASDPDTGQTLAYSILSGNTSGAFAINPSSGIITVANANALGSGTEYSLFQSTTPPGTSTYIYGNGTAPYEIGMKFSSNISGYITGFRYYKGVGMQGTHTGNLWSNDGIKLASANFTNETGSGWQTVTLNTPVAITANTIYVVSYFSQNGDFVFSRNYFTTNIVNGPLTALASSTAQPNGVYKQTAVSAFPTLSNLQTNYWADLLFTSSPPPPPSFALVVKVQDNGAQSLSSQATVTINLNATKSVKTLKIISIPPDSVVARFPYSYNVFSSSENDNPITYSVENLPYWLHFTDNGNGTGRFEGIPNIDEIGTYQIILEGKNNTEKVQQVFTIHVKSNLLGEISSQRIPYMYIYPNPVTNGILNVKLDGDILEQFELSIWEISGKLLMKEYYYQSDLILLDLLAFPPGIYLIQIHNKSIQFLEKFIIR